MSTGQNIAVQYDKKCNAKNGNNKKLVRTTNIFPIEKQIKSVMLCADMEIQQLPQSKNSKAAIEASDNKIPRLSTHGISASIIY